MFTLISISTRLFCVRSPSFLTSLATTARPIPCSPARAASMAAFSANRFVCSATSYIIPSTSFTWSAFVLRPAGSEDNSFSISTKELSSLYTF